MQCLVTYRPLDTECITDNITPEAPFTLDVDIIYLDQLITKKGISVFSKTDNAVVIKLKGTLYKEGLKQKEVEVEESSSEISMATLVVDQGGKFNQSSLSSALTVVRLA